MISRLLLPILQQQLSDSKVLVLLGPRQVGKNTLTRELLKGLERVRFLTGDETDVQSIFANGNLAFFQREFAGIRILVIDEAQRIGDIGLRLKLLADGMPELKVIVTGSSAIELANRAQEPLTGRKWEHQLYALSFEEMAAHHGLLEEKRLLHTRLLYGYYPEVVTSPGKEREVLRSLTDSFLYKDILGWEGIQKPQKLITLLQALAWQVGNTVSYNELSGTVGLDKKTVEKYLDLLQKAFVIFRLGSFSRNLRTELTQTGKFYFYDTGIRNALIAGFQPPDLRADIGGLWENFMVAERIKYLAYHKVWANRYFWRTAAQQEIDWLEVADGMLRAVEIKWNPQKQPRLPKTFAAAYPDHSFEVWHRDNFFEALLPPAE